MRILRRLSSTVAAELDATARWARRASAEDRRRLEPPPFPSAAPSTESLDAYLSSRGWSLPGDDAADRACARRVVSHTLTYPMSLAAHAPRLLSLARAGAADAGSETELRVGVIGARAEASLPTQWWRELLAARPDVARWSVHFLGPQLAAPAAARAPIGAPPRLEVASLCGRRALELTFECAAFPGAGAPARWDALALFNPGFGHHALVGAWEEALRAMLRGGAPMLVTAHSERDALRDRAAIERAARAVGMRPEDVWVERPALNAFRSRKKALDPADPQHVTAANWSAAVVQGRAPQA